MHAAYEVVVVEGFLHEIICMGEADHALVAIFAGHHDDADEAGVGVAFQLAAEGVAVLVGEADIHENEHGFMNPYLEYRFFNG